MTNNDSDTADTFLAFAGSIALVRHPDDIERRWLAIWNDKRQHFEFLTSHRLEHETFRDSVDRAIGWNLQLRRGKDYIVSSVPRLHLDLAERSAADPQSVEFFVVDIYGGSGRVTVDNNPQTSWLSNEELLRGTTASGQAIDPWLVALLRQADVLSKR